jgi:Tfp pilus assembly ATPase PilU
MQTFNQALAKLVMDRVVTEAEALGSSSNPNDLKLMLRGVVSGARSTETRPAGAGMKITKGF